MRRALRAGSSGSPLRLFPFGEGDGVVAVVCCEDDEENGENASDTAGDGAEHVVVVAVDSMSWQGIYKMVPKSEVERRCARGFQLFVDGFLDADVEISDQHVNGPKSLSDVE